MSGWILVVVLFAYNSGAMSQAIPMESREACVRALNTIIAHREKHDRRVNCIDTRTGEIIIARE